ncbi:50S ribosomal protein L25/general stress protein Ctc, partial [Methylophaga sp. 42_8_T64]
MKNLFEVQAELRTDEGKGASRRLRHAGKLPAIVYGGENAPVALTLDHNKFLRHLAEESFYAHILTLNVDGKEQQVVLKDLQRHPASDVRIMHADFLRVDANHAVIMTVPLHFIGEDEAPGVKEGGKVNHLFSDIEVSCLPQDLPEFVEVDVSALDMDESLHLSEIVLPEGVVLTALSHGQKEDLAEGERSAYDQAFVSIHAPRAVADEDDTAVEADAE